MIRIRGLKLISAAKEDTERIKALSEDLDDIRKDTMLHVKKAESIAPEVQVSSKIF